VCACGQALCFATPLTFVLRGAPVQFVGTLLGFGVPLLAAIGPIRGALSRNLRDALDIHRPKADAVRGVFAVCHALLCVCVFGTPMLVVLLVYVRTLMVLSRCDDGGGGLSFLVRSSTRLNERRMLVSHGPSLPLDHVCQCLVSPSTTSSPCHCFP